MSGLVVERLQRPGVDAAGLAVEPGQCVALSGPSGSGKTLLLRAIADLDEADGRVRLDDRDRSTFSGPAWRRAVTYVAADSAWWAPRVRAHAEHWRDADLVALGFTVEVLDWDVTRLSSGERQRLALARALAHAPQVLLLDEPTANLDTDNGARVEHLLTDWRNAGGMLVWVSHDPAQRLRVATRHWQLRGGRLEHADE